MMRRLVIFLFVFTAAVSAKDKTPYKFIFGGNSYSGSRNASVLWLAERYDAAIAGVADWPGLHDSLYDACRAMGKEFWDGPYSSSQEINLYDGLNPAKQYGDRLKDVKDHWLYVYAKRYLDSVGVSVESLVVHTADDYVSITNDGDGLRAYNLSGLPHQKKRFTYQYWNNTSSDTMFYPAGYCWLANGYNATARKAIAYAYRRYILEDSARYGPGDHHWGAYFMDNQYRQGTSPRLSSYYTINSTSGGPTAGLDWMEQPGIGNDGAANLRYYDKSTMLIDSTIAATLDSVCRVRGLKPVRGFANVDKAWPSHLSVQIKYTNVTFENPVDYTKACPNGWEMWYDMADTMAAHPERYVIWMFLGDFICSSNPSDWKYDSSRIYLTHYAFFLQVRDTNAFMGPVRFNDTTRWREMYELDFGKPDAPAYEVSSTGSGYGKIAVMRRDYSNGRVAVLVRTAHGSADFVRDSVAVNLHKLYREVTANADTLTRVDSIFYMKPYTGKILLLDDGSRPAISNIQPSPALFLIDSAATISFTVSDADGLDTLRARLGRPSGDTLVINMAFPPGVTSYNARFTYKWKENDCGFSDLAIYARDKKGNVTWAPKAADIITVGEIVGVGNAVVLIRFIFEGDIPPEDLFAVDANCDSRIDLGDPLYIINFLFRGGPPVCCSSGGTGGP